MKTIRLFAAPLLGAALALLAGCGPNNSSNSTPAPGGSNPPAITEKAPTAEPSKTGDERKSEMVLIKGGKFLMGDKNEVDATPHEVTVSPYYLDARLVTQDQFQKLMGANPARWKGGNNPVEQVRWSDAVKYCNKRSESEGLQPCYDLQNWSCNFEATGYRLPTEAEWEFACRAGTTTRYFFGDTPAKLGDYAWFDKNSGGHPRPVGQKQPNPLGLYDMCGNLWQWCNDFYQVDYYQESPKQDPRGPAMAENKVVRGGAWKFSDENCRSGYRYNESPGYADVCFGYDIYGFRCARNATGAAGAGK
jgi:formylglycine-generating enzyme required for sulfatase activity